MAYNHSAFMKKKWRDPAYQRKVSKGLKGKPSWNKGIFGYKKKPCSEQGKKHIADGVRRAWAKGKMDHVDYSKTPAQRKKLSVIRKRFYKDHPEAAKAHSEHLKGKMAGSKNPNWGKKHPGINAGKANHFYVNGQAYEPYTTEFNTRFKNEIRQRDQVCMICHQNGMRKLAVHHIDYNKKHTTRKNCLALCHSCHPKTNTNRRFWKKKLQALMRRRFPIG